MELTIDESLTINGTEKRKKSQNIHTQKRQTSFEGMHSSPQHLVNAGICDQNPLLYKYRNDGNTNKIKIKTIDNPKNIKERNKQEKNKNKKININNNPKMRSNNKFMISTLNVRSLASEDRIAELEHALEKIRWDIIGLAEVRKINTIIEERRDYVLCYSGIVKGHFGVGFIVKREHKHNIIGFKGYSDRIALLRYKLNDEIINIIQVYAHTTNYEHEEIELFYENLYNVICEYEKEKIIVMGDFNGKIGIKNMENPIMGNYGSPGRNGNGERIIGLCQETNMKIMNTFFKKRKQDRWTWISPDKRTKNEIDYILTNDHRIIIDVHVINLKFNTDHRLLRGIIKLKKPKKSREKYGIKKITPIEWISRSERFKEKLQENIIQYSQMNIKNDIQEYYDKLEITLKESMQYIVNNETKIRKNTKLSEKTINIIQERSKLHKKENKSNEEKIMYTEICKIAKRSIKNDLRIYKENIIEEELQNTISTKRIQKKLQNHSKWIPTLQDKENKTHSNREDLVNAATKFYQDLYSSKISEEECLTITPNLIDRNEPEEPKILKSEITKAIKSLNLEKSPGPDKIPAEALKIGEEEILDTLETIFNEILRTEYIPNQWLQANIVLIFKKGNRQDINNYRPISLIPVMYKLFVQIIMGRINRTLEEEQSEEQAGFRKTYSTIDHIHTLTQLMEKSTEYQEPLYLLFIDFFKAFDCIEHCYIWHALKQQRIPLKYIRIFKNIYDGSKANLKLEREGPKFNIKRGVKQGDPASAKLFIAVLEMIFRKLNWAQYGIKIDGETLTHLRFADDIVLIERKEENLQNMLNQLTKESMKVGLQINISKTKVLSNQSESKLTINNEKIEKVQEFLYLGQSLSFKKRTQNEIKNRINKAWRCFWSLKHILKGPFPLNSKQKVMDMCVLPTLTYACQTWAPTKTEMTKIRSCQRKMERYILNIKLMDKINSKSIRSRTNMLDALYMCKKLKWKWAGHIIRARNERWSTKITKWYPRNEKRRRGRQITRWRDEITAFQGPLWPRIARDREEWRKLGQSFCEQCASK